MAGDRGKRKRDPSDEPEEEVIPVPAPTVEGGGGRVVGELNHLFQTPAAVGRRYYFNVDDLWKDEDPIAMVVDGGGVPVAQGEAIYHLSDLLKDKEPIAKVVVGGGVPVVQDLFPHPDDEPDEEPAAGDGGDEPEEEVISVPAPTVEGGGGVGRRYYFNADDLWKDEDPIAMVVDGEGVPVVQGEAIYRLSDLLKDEEPIAKVVVGGGVPVVQDLFPLPYEEPAAGDGGDLFPHPDDEPDDEPHDEPAAGDGRDVFPLPDEEPAAGDGGDLIPLLDEEPAAGDGGDLVINQICVKRLTPYQFNHQLRIPQAVRNHMTMDPMPGHPTWYCVKFQKVENGGLFGAQQQLILQMKGNDLVTGRTSWATFKVRFRIEREDNELVYYSVTGHDVRNRFGLSVNP